MMYDTTKPYKEEILEAIKSTWETPYVSLEDGAYPIIKKEYSYPKIQHTDGIGTKGVYHWEQRTFREAVLDALAMNVNDLAMYRATPYLLQNHIILPKDDHGAVVEIVRAMADECRKRKIAMSGGETSIQNNMEGMDISMTVSGFIKKEQPNEFKIGDVIVGLKSNGIHSNGFTKVRELFGEKFLAEFVSPTRIYWDRIMDIAEKYYIHGMMHITGGGFTKLKGLARDADIVIRKPSKLLPQEIFKEIHKRGVSEEEMYKTFNCGIGFVLSASSTEAHEFVSHTDEEVIGEVVRGEGKIKIESAFDGGHIEW